MIVFLACGTLSLAKTVLPKPMAARLLNGDDANLAIAAALVAESRQTLPRLGSGAQCLGERDEERYSQGNRNRRADGCG